MELPTERLELEHISHQVKNKMGQNNGLAILLLGIGALYLLGGARGEPAYTGSQPAYYPGQPQIVYFPSQAPMTTLYMEGVQGGPSRPEAEARLTFTKVGDKVYHTGYTKAEEAWRRAQPARSIGRGGGQVAR